MLVTFGEKYTEKEVKQFYEIVTVDDGKMDCQYICDMMTGKLRDDDAPAE